MRSTEQPWRNDLVHESSAYASRGRAATSMLNAAPHELCGARVALWKRVDNAHSWAAAAVNISKVYEYTAYCQDAASRTMTQPESTKLTVAQQGPPSGAAPQIRPSSKMECSVIAV